MNDEQDSNILTPAEVARLFKVDPKTVARWSKQRKFTEIRTPGGHRRYLKSEIYAHLPKSMRPEV